MVRSIDHASILVRVLFIKNRKLFFIIFIYLFFNKRNSSELLNIFRALRGTFVSATFVRVIHL